MKFRIGDIVNISDGMGLYGGETNTYEIGEITKLSTIESKMYLIGTGIRRSGWVYYYGGIYEQWNITDLLSTGSLIVGSIVVNKERSRDNLITRIVGEDSEHK